MTKSRIIYFFMLLIAIVFSQALYDPISLIMFIIALLLPIISIIFAFISYPMIKLKASILTSKLCRFDSFVLSILIRNYSPFIQSTFKIYCKLPCEEGTSVISRIFVINCPLGRRNFFSCNAAFAHRGIYQISVAAVEYYDFLKLIKIKKVFDKKIDITILPRMVDIGIPLIAETINMENRDAISSNQITKEGEIAGVREYEDGDILRNVHWKLSSKSQQLLVKIFTEDISAQVNILCDLCAYSQDEYVNRRVIDCVVETTLYSTNFFVQNSIRSNLYFRDFSNYINTYEITSPDDQMLTYAAISLTPPIISSDIFETIELLDLSRFSGTRVYLITSFISDEQRQKVTKIFKSIDCMLSIIIIAPENEILNFANTDSLTILQCEAIEQTIKGEKR